MGRVKEDLSEKTYGESTVQQVLGWDTGPISALLWQVPSEVLEIPGLVAPRPQLRGSLQSGS